MTTRTRDYTIFHPSFGFLKVKATSQKAANRIAVDEYGYMAGKIGYDKDRFPNCRSVAPEVWDAAWECGKLAADIEEETDDGVRQISDEDQ